MTLTFASNFQSTATVSLIEDVLPSDEPHQADAVLPTITNRVEDSQVALQVDRKALECFLDMLGLEPSEGLHLRAFAPKRLQPTKEQIENGSKHLQGISPSQPFRSIEAIEGWANNVTRIGYDPYFVVNAGGQSKEHITRYRAIFAEFDDITKEKQLEIFQEKMLSPSGMTDSKNSIHAYWVFDEPVSPELGEQLQKDLLAYLRCDPSIGDRSRVMRLPGSWHTKDVIPHLCAFTLGEKKYSYQELRNVVPTVPEPKKVEPLKNNQQKPKVAKNNLVEDERVIKRCLELLPIAEYCEPREKWLKVSMAIHASALDPETAWEIFDTWSQQGSNYDEAENRRIWNSFDRDKDGITLGSLIYWAEEYGSVDEEENYRTDRQVQELIWMAQTYIQQNPNLEAVKKAVEALYSRKLASYRDTIFEKLSRRLPNGITVDSLKAIFSANDAKKDHQDVEFPPLSKEMELFYILEEHYAQRFTFNTMDRLIYLDGMPLRSIDEFDLRLTNEWGKVYPKERLASWARAIAMRNSFSPVINYLLGLKWDGVPRLETVPQRILGMDDPIFGIFFRKWMISGVARPLEPGCQVDLLAVLTGKQGIKKSTFFRILGRGWHTEYTEDDKNKDGLLKLSIGWLIELAEIEAITGNRDINSLKGFITRTKDDFRPPYGASMESVLRSCVLCGTANDGEFLKDSTGSRRFLVFPVPKLIDTKQLSAEVDQLWAEAVHIFLNTSIREREEQCLWWLTPDEEAIQEQINDDYTTTDSLEEKVLKALQEKTNLEKGFYQMSSI